MIFPSYDVNKRKNTLKFADGAYCDIPSGVQKRRLKMNVALLEITQITIKLHTEGLSNKLTKVMNKTC